MWNNTGAVGATSPSADPTKELEYKARRAMEVSAAAREATQRGTPSYKAKAWRVGESPSHFDR
jgi:hypothetical protein